MGIDGIIAIRHKAWSSCAPPGSVHEQWRALRPAVAEAKASGEFSVDETEAILFALARAVEQRDRRTAGHCERLAFMGVALGMAMRLDRISLLALYRGGYLHDVGKVGIPDSILFKPGKLTAEEWVTMRSHAVRGEEICRHLKSLGPALPIIRHHHERWDGSGYPDGLRGAQIAAHGAVAAGGGYLRRADQPAALQARIFPEQGVGHPPRGNHPRLARPSGGGSVLQPAPGRDFENRQVHHRVGPQPPGAAFVAR